jgi:hypothetical protein
MPAKMNLWPTDFSVPETVTAPVTILLDQALALGETTKHLVEGEVRTYRGIDRNSLVHAVVDDEIVHSFLIKAPYLDNYRYSLFHVRHKALPYPLTISEVDNKPDVVVHNEEEFLNRLKRVFDSEEARRVIQSLIQQSLVEMPNSRDEDEEE